MKIKEELIKSDYKFKGKIFTVREDTVLLPNGQQANREVIEHPGGVSILAITNDRKILMVEQFRAGPRIVTLEVPAGKLEYGEDPKACGLRELVEETGYIAGKFEKIGSFYLTPGYANELIYIYVAKELTYDKSNPDNDEFLNVKAYDYETLLQMVMNNEIKDAKTVISILFAKEYLKR